MASTARTRAALLIATGLVAAAAVVVVLTLQPPGGDTTTGTGLTYDNRWYWASSSTVADAALGPAVATGVAFQDTHADLRSISGFDPAVALAARLPSLDGSPGGLRWTFVSTDRDRGTNPRGYDDSRAVLVPAP